jgi:hypothetical protein
MNPEGKILVDNEIVFKRFGEYRPIYSESLFMKGEDRIITETFIQDSPVEMIGRTFQYAYNDWMVYSLLLLLFGISLVWYYFPERALSIFKISDSVKNTRSNFSTGNETPGIMILLFFIINYLLTISLFLYLSSIKFFPAIPDKTTGQELLVFFILGIVSLYIFKILIIFFTGFLFNTSSVANKQLSMYINIDNIIGVLLIPILILILFVQGDVIIYTGFGILLVFQFVKWFQTFNLAISISGFSVLHLFMYLCALELLPVAVLIKLFIDGFI